MDRVSRLNAAFVDRYEIKRTLRAGGMATVYLATDARHGREVAIKVLHSDVAGSLEHDLFNREIRLAAGLTHPHILPLHDSGEADGILFFGKALAAARDTSVLTQVGVTIGTPASSVATIMRRSRHSSAHSSPIPRTSSRTGTLRTSDASSANWMRRSST